MLRTNLALKRKARDALLADWTSLHRAPGYYPYQPWLTPHPFMGLDKFVARRIHQMRAGKSYLAAHPYWWEEVPDYTCSRCASAPETFAHAILYCPRKNPERSLLLAEVSSLDAGSTLWSTGHLIRAFGQFITATHTGFPPDMHPFSPPTSFSPSPSPPPAGECMNYGIYTFVFILYLL